MSRPRLAVALAMALLPCTAVAQEFEGVIRSREIRVQAEAYLEATDTEPEGLFEVTAAVLLDFGAGVGAADTVFEVRNFVMSISGPRVRLESPDGALFGPGGYVTIDMDLGLYRIVLPTNGAYVEWTVDDMARLLPNFTAPDRSRPPAGGGFTTPLERTRVIDGRETTGHRIVTPDETKVVWLASDLRDLGTAVRGFTVFASAMRFGENAAEAPGDDVMLQEMGALYARGFPALTASLDGETFSLTELQEVQRMPVDGRLFLPPSGLMRLPLEALLQGGG